MPAEALLTRPLEVRGVRPIPPEPHLDDPAPLERALLDQEPQGRPVGERHPVQLRDVVRVRVEVDQPERLARGLQMIRHGAHVRVRDRMVAAEDDRDDAGRADLAHRLADRRVAASLVGRNDLRVAVVHDREHLGGAHTQVHARPVEAGADIGLPYRPRAVAGARPVRHGLVDRRADDRDVGTRQVRRVQHERDLREGGDPRVAGLVGSVDDHPRHAGPKPTPPTPCAAGPP